MSVIGSTSHALPGPRPAPTLHARDPGHDIGLQQAVDSARRCLLSRQQRDGHWVGELQGDTILESEYILLMAFLGREAEPRVHKAAAYLLQQQQPEGGWNNYPEGPIEVSVSVKAYFALKLAGHDADAPSMRQARAAIRQLGGAAQCNSFTKFYLALLGQFPYANCASVPPEMMFLPRWAYLNIYAMSSWTRTIVVPLSICYAHQPVRQLPPERGIGELFLEPPATPLWPHPPDKRWLTWTNFFLGVDQAIKWLERWGPRWVRRAGIRRAARWMLDHFAASDGVGAIFPPIIYTIISLRCLGYADNAPEMRWALKQLEDLVLEDDDTLRVQPCFSPVWDTALSLNALALAGLPTQHRAVARAARWLLEREVRQPGDWSTVNPHLEPAGWFFEYRNGFYPDTDDTAMVLMALARTGHAGTPQGHPAAERGLRWLLGMQNKDGGWAAFDRDINREILTKVPFADHNAMLDPSCPDITARVLEALGQFGYRVGHPSVDRAIAFIAKTQDRRGCWLGRWGVNYLYGTWQVVLGLQAVEFDMRQPMLQRAVGWLKSVQQPGGGWGETCRSYDDPTLAGQGSPTASQTAWALLALIAAGETGSDEVKAGVDYLVATQQSDGNWFEEPFTGTGFPKVFYLKYHMYSLYFPLMALARYASAVRHERVLAFPSSRPEAMTVKGYYTAERESALTTEHTMRFPLSLTTTMVGYLAKKKLSGARRFPLVLMLEPLHACNLTCTGCGRIREYETTIKDKLSVAECLASVDECGAPIVSICGGEPLIYPEIGKLVRSILQRRKHIYLCTNGMFIKRRLHEFKATSRFFFNVHLDGLEETHDRAVERDGVFRAAIQGIQAAKAAGHLVCTNTTVFKDTNMDEIDALYAYLTRLGVDGFMLSPAYGYTAVQETNPEGAAEIFLTRDDIRAKFQEAQKLLVKYRMASSPVYLEFLSGQRELTCTAWGNPTRNVKGWKGPCYLITDEHHETFEGLMNDTPWEEYGHGKDPRCENCMVHCGYEPSAALGVNKKFGDSWKMLKWQLS